MLGDLINLIRRIYSEKDVSSMTIEEISKFIELEQLQYCADFGLKSEDRVKLVFSKN